MTKRLMDTLVVWGWPIAMCLIVLTCAYAPARSQEPEEPVCYDAVSIHEAARQAGMSVVNHGIAFSGLVVTILANRAGDWSMVVYRLGFPGCILIPAEGTEWKHMGAVGNE